MDFTRFAFICVACIAMLRLAEAGCVEETEGDRTYQECLTAYQTFLAGAGDSGTDGTQMMGVMCSPEGQTAMSCLQPYIDACEELKANAMLQVFTVIEQMGGCPGNDVCATAKQTCLAVMSSSDTGTTAEQQGTTEFNSFQEAIKHLCGVTKALLDCLKQHEEECPDLENEMKEMMKLGQQQSMPGKPAIEFDQQKDFVMKECPKLPQDFPTNKCVKDKLMTPEYTGCYNNASKDHAKMEDSQTMTCDGYKAAFGCVTTALETCGKKYQDGFRATGNYYLSATHQNCKLTAEDTTGSANIPQMSSATIVTLLFMVFKLSFM